MRQTANIAGAQTPEQNAPVEPLKLLKRIGSTTYQVSVHFSTNSRETMGDKIVRLLEKEALQA